MTRFKRLNVPELFLSRLNLVRDDFFLKDILELKKHHERLQKEFIVTDTVFNRDGFYLDRKTNKTWVEIDGSAWLYSNAQYFNDQLEINCGSNRLSNDKFLMLSGLISSNIINYRKHKDLYRMYLIQHAKRELRIY